MFIFGFFIFMILLLFIVFLIDFLLIFFCCWWVDFWDCVLSVFGEVILMYIFLYGVKVFDGEGFGVICFDDICIEYWEFSYNWIYLVWFFWKGLGCKIIILELKGVF